MAVASTIEILELAGQQRRVVLRGAALPFRGAAWETEMKLVTKWYAGNSFQATQHVLGAMDPPSEFNGMWRTTTLIATPPSFYNGSGASEQLIVIASDLRDIFDGDTGIIRSGSLLSVAWASDDGRSIVRQGRIGSGKFSHDRFDDIAWTMSFQWTGRGAGTGQAAQYSGDDALVAQRAMSSSLNDLANEIPGLNSPLQSDVGLPNSATATSLGQFELVTPSFSATLFAASDDAVQLSAQLQSSYTTSTQSVTPFDQSSDAGTAAAVALIQQFNLVQELGQVPVELMAQPAAQAGDTIAIAAWGARVENRAIAALEKAVALKQATALSQNALTAQQRNKVGAAAVQATRVAKSGDTFTSLALAQYGSADLAGQLARTNGVPSYQVSPDVGTVLVFPSFNAADQSAP